MATLNRPAPPVWWLNPAILFALIGGVTVIAAWVIPASIYEEAWGSVKYFDDAALFYGLASVVLFAIGAAARLPRRNLAFDNPDWAANINWPRAIQLFRICVWLCFTGYAIWIGAAISRGADLALVAGVLTGEKDASYLMKDTYLITVGGLTTLTQFGIVGVILGCILASAGHWRRVRLSLLAIVGLAVLRAILNSERLAVIELIVPALIVLLQLPAITVRLRRDYPVLIYILPFAAALGVFLLFTGSEYLRSWVNFYAGRNDSIWVFAATRLSGYYVTALNNSAYLLRHEEILGTAPYFTALFLWRFPVASVGVRWLFPHVFNDTTSVFDQVLAAGTNPEFNNNGGLYLPMVDYNITGGLLYWLLAGSVCGWCYRSYRQNAVPGLLVYPILMLGILEVPRIVYWAEGRVFPAFLLIFAAIPLLRPLAAPIMKGR